MARKRKNNFDPLAAAVLASDLASETCTRFLSAPATHGGQAPERRETHISHLFLTRDRAYKLKKPVKLSFLDFSTLALREEACRRELAVNRAFAPDLYLGLRPLLAEPGGAIRFGPLLTAPDAALPDIGEAAVLDWIVEMRRFDKGAEFDQLAQKGALSVAQMRALADRVSASHRAAPKAPADQRGAAPLETIAQVEAALQGAPAAGAAAAWAALARREAARIDGLIQARRRHGFPRRLHGDLHLGNICLLDGAPTPFDAIEFDDAIATVDPLYDVAFTVMDLLWRGQEPLAQAFLSRYLAATRDYGGLAAWPLFLSMRAAIRAMTAMLSGDAALALGKLRFAWRFLAEREADRRPPLLLVVAGLSGTGKSTLAGALAPRLAPFGGAVSISSDVTRKRLLGRTPEDRLPAQCYAPAISAEVYRRLGVDARRALAAGASVVLDGVYGRRRERDGARALAKRLGADFQGFWLEAPLASRLERVEARAAAPARDPSDADRAVAAAQVASLESDEPGWRTLSAGGDPQQTLAHALAHLGPAYRMGGDPGHSFAFAAHPQQRAVAAP